MTVSLHVPYRGYDELRTIAEGFLRKHDAWGVLPVDIESIIDVQMGIDIIPVPGLLRDFDIDAFISSDCTSITVDDSAYSSGRNLNRHRFSLAHEVAHAILHRDALALCRFGSIDEYRRFMCNTDEKVIRRMEIQSRDLAGLLLVPSALLGREIELVIQQAESEQLLLPKLWDVASDYVYSALGTRFDVSAEVIEKRLQKDGLCERLLQGT